MDRAGARAALLPLASSPARLSLAGAAVVLAVFLIQISSGVPPWRAFAPVELSSNVVAAAGLAWTLIELRAHWGEPPLRAAWAAAMAGMALLTVDGTPLTIAPLEAYGVEEMGVSIATWAVAAALLFWAARRFSAKASALPLLGLGLGVQAIAQYAGWLALGPKLSPTGAELLEYLNDIGELAATLAYLFALLVAEFAPVRELSFAPAGAGHVLRGAGEVIPFVERRASAQRFAAAGLAFPTVYRLTGFSWREDSLGEPRREPHLAYVFGDTDLSGVEHASRIAFARPDPAIDRGWVIVRRHRGPEAAEAYLSAAQDFSDDGARGPVLQTADGVFTISRRAPRPGAPEPLLIYAAEAPNGESWTLVLDSGGNELPSATVRRVDPDAPWID